VRLLVRPDGVEAVSEAVFRETTTLGLRIHPARRAVLRRRERIVGGVRVKTADRPGGSTAKAEVDDTRDHEAHAHRAGHRHAAEAAALAGEDDA